MVKNDKKQKLLSLSINVLEELEEVCPPKNFSQLVEDLLKEHIELKRGMKPESLLEEIQENKEYYWLFLNRERFKDLLFFDGVYGQFCNSTGSTMSRKQVKLWLLKLEKSTEDFSELEIHIYTNNIFCPVCHKEFCTYNPKINYNKSINFNVCNDCLENNYDQVVQVHENYKKLLEERK